MIALNELIENYEQYKNKYELLGIDYLDKIIALEDERKSLQMTFEDLRAKTNKLCNELAIKKSKNEQIEEIFEQILLNEKQLEKYENKLNILSNEINQKLKKLPNLPDKIIENNIVISNNNNPSNFEDLLIKISQFKTDEFNMENARIYGKNQVLKQLSNYIFEDNQVIVILQKNKQILLVTQNKFEEILNFLINYLNQNSIKLIQKSTQKLSHSSSDEFEAKINNYENIKLEVKREYFTRLYNIKYKCIEKDMTKFLNEIDIIFK